LHLCRLLEKIVPILALFFLTGFSGLLLLIPGKKNIDRIKVQGLLFAFGTLAGTIFFHMVPEFIEHNPGQYAYLLLAVPSFLFWFFPLLFKKKKSDEAAEKNSIWALLFGDAIHNAFTSILWVSLCLSSGRPEMMILPALFIHEIPHKASNYGILIFSGINKFSALAYSLFSTFFFFSGLFLYSTELNVNGKVLIPIIIGTLSYSLFRGLYSHLKTLKKLNMAIWFLGGVFLMVIFTLLTAELEH